MLEHYGGRGNALKLIQSYLSNRTQYVQGKNFNLQKHFFPRLDTRFFVLCAIHELRTLFQYYENYLFADDSVLVG